MVNRPFRAWLEQQRDLWRYRTYGVSINVAAKAMFRLNRAAKGSIQADSIYKLKNAMVKWLYQNGYCADVGLDRQDLVCFRCEGSGKEPYHWYDDDEFQGDCERCGGSGIYATHYLYVFVFKIIGEGYIWRQPQKLVDWPVELSSDAVVREYDNKTTHEYMPSDEMDKHFMMVYACLRNRGVPADELPKLIGLKESIKTSLRRWWHAHNYIYPTPLWLKPIYAVRDWKRQRDLNKVDIPF